MLQWFRDRIKNSRPWFCVTTPINKVEGTKCKDGSLDLRVSSSDRKIELKLDRESADRMSEWFAVHYPYRRNNVIQLTPKLKTVNNTEKIT